MDSLLLYNIVQKGDLKLLRKHFPVEDIDKMYGNTLLHAASYCNHVDCVQFLLEHGASPFQRTIQGKLSEDLTKNPEILGLLKIYRKKHIERQEEEEELRQEELNKTPPVDFSGEFKNYEFKSPERSRNVSNLDIVVTEKQKSRERYYTLMDEKIRENIHLSLSNERLEHENSELVDEIRMLRKEMDSMKRIKTEYVISKNELVQSRLQLEKTVSRNRTLLMQSRSDHNDLKTFKKKYVVLEKSFSDLQNRTMNDTRNLNQTMNVNTEILEKTQKENKKIIRAYTKLKKKHLEICSQYCISTED